MISSRSVARIRPTFSSISSTASPYRPRWLWLSNSRERKSGMCGTLWARYRKKGRSIVVRSRIKGTLKYSMFGAMYRWKRCRVEVRPSLTLCGHAIEVWRPDRRMPLAAEIAVALIVRDHDDDVRRPPASYLLPQRRREP